MDAVAERALDVDLAVRKEAFATLAHADARSLSDAQRRAVVLAGFGHEDESVNAACAVLVLRSWLPHYKGGVTIAALFWRR